MVERFRGLVTAQGWHFSYGRRDFHNLEEIEGVTNYFFLDPLKSTANLSNGFEDGRDYEGRFMLISPSSLDQNYDAQHGQNKDDGKWTTNILPKKDLIKEGIMKPFECSKKHEILAWSETDVINLLDFNGDGILVSFKIREL